MNSRSSELSLRDFPCQIEIPVSWGDMDAYQHVNNTKYIRYFEDIRAEVCTKTNLFSFLERTGIGPVVATLQCSFKRSVVYPDTILACAGIENLRDDRFTVRYQLISKMQNAVVATGETLMINVNLKESKKATIAPEIREGLLKYCMNP